MTYSADMEAPYTISSLSKPLDSTHGRTQGAPVFSVQGSKQRKRHEVALGIDGEGVHIYNVQSQRLVASYAIPPQNYFCHTPCSVYVRATAISLAQRRTYVVITDGPNDERRRLVCFTETVKKTRDAQEDVSPPEKTECKIPDGDIVGIDAVLSSRNNGIQAIVVVYKNGDTVSTNGELSKTEVRERPRMDGLDEYEVEYATVVDVEKARQGLLKSREDIIALLDRNSPPQTLLCWVIRAPDGRRFQLYSQTNLSYDGVSTLRSGFSLIMSCEIPSSNKANPENLQYGLHAASGTLYQLLAGRLTIYDLSGNVPKVITWFGGRSVPVSSFARISATSVIAVSRETATLYETRYGSIQSSVNLTGQSQTNTGMKRKRGQEKNQYVSFNILSSSSELGLVVGISENQLLALHLNDAVRASRRPKSRSTLLSDIMGKGSTKEASNMRKAEKKAKKWIKWTEKVNELMDTDDIEGLEKLVANDEKLGKQRSRMTSAKLDHTDGLQDGDRTAYEELWPLPESFDPNDVDQRKVIYILGKVFVPAGIDDRRLEITLPALKLLEWLALVGHLSVLQVERAMRQAMSEADLRGFTVQPGDIIAAIREIDDDFQLMHDLLSLPVHWEIEEMVRALRILLQSFDSDTPEDATLKLPAPSQLNGDIEMTNGDADSHLDFESKAAENELDYAMRALNTGLEVRSDTLRVIIARLEAFHQPVLTSTMRAMMSQRELVFFIHILRIELADGGWTSTYVREGEDTEETMANPLGGVDESTPSSHAIKVIADLLNCAVDAIGTSGWLVGLGDSAEDLLLSLKAEVSAALEGCIEANTILTYLTDIEKCAGSMQQTQDQDIKPKREEGTTTLDKALLPMGGRVAPPIVKGRNDKVGKKSKMALARETRMKVGKYSFERIRI